MVAVREAGHHRLFCPEGCITTDIPRGPELISIVIRKWTLVIRSWILGYVNRSPDTVLFRTVLVWFRMASVRKPYEFVLPGLTEY